MAKSRVPKVWLRPRVAPETLPEPPTTVLPKKARRNRADTTRLKPFDPEFWTVINEITDSVPVSPDELNAIESYFSAVLDDVFDSSRKSYP